jgi:hypothetical protein
VSESGRAVIGLVAVLMLTACEADTHRWLDRQAAVDPPALWQVETPDGDARPVRICADRKLSDGFADLMPSVQGQACEISRAPVEIEGGKIQTCTLSGQKFLVRTRKTGSADRFTVDFRTERLNARPPQVFVQQRRYVRLGPCPKGWRVGDNSDQDGGRSNKIWPSAW